MSDWRNQILAITNKIKQQLHSKKIDDLEFVNKWVEQFDTDKNGYLDKYEFEQLLSKIGIFLTTQELRCIYNTYDENKDGKITYAEFVQMIRTQISEKRLAVVKHAFQFIDKSKQGVIPLETLFKLYDAQQHPRVKSRQKSVDQIRQEFEFAISKKSSDGKNISENEFLDYYADVNATLPNEKEEYFVGLLLNTWSVTASEDYVSPERLADLEIILFEKIRQKTITKDDEGKTVKKAFKQFDLMDSGVIDINQFKSALDIFGCIFSQKEIQALFNKYDRDRSGRLCYDEFSGLIATIGAGNNKNVKTVFDLQKQPPSETIQRIKKELNFRQLGNDFIQQCFTKSDKNSNGSLDRDEFRWAMRDAGFQLTETEFINLFKYFDKNNDNAIYYNEFVQLLQ